MKRTFIKVLPLVAAVFLATSCSKDGSDDSIVIDNPAENHSESKTIPFSITVGKDSKHISKASLQDGTELTQVFEAGDQLVLKNGETEVATLSLPKDYTSGTEATFSGNLKTEGLESGKTSISVTLKNAGNNNPETSLTEVKEATSLAEAFQKYGYWTSSFTYNEGENPTITLDQNTVFLRIKPFCDAGNKAIVNGKEYTAQSDGTIYLAVASGSQIASNLFSGIKTVTNEGGKVVKNIDRSQLKSNDINDNSLTGVFTVSSDGKKVCFSKGNLRASTSDLGTNWTFGFPVNQYDYLDNDGVNAKVNVDGTVSENGTVDLFGWVGASSTGTGAAMFGISCYNGVYGEDFKNIFGKNSNEALKSDWGTLMGDGKTWRTLSTEEWQYLLGTTFERTSNNGTGVITIGEKKIFGLIIVPDNYEHPEGVRQFVAGTGQTEYSESDWAAMQDKGAVFLPAVGYRSGSEVICSPTYEGGIIAGYYWSSSAHNTYAYAWNVVIDKDYISNPDYSGRYLGFSVRLVRDYQEE